MIFNVDLIGPVGINKFFYSFTEFKAAIKFIAKNNIFLTEYKKGQLQNTLNNLISEISNSIGQPESGMGSTLSIETAGMRINRPKEHSKIIEILVDANICKKKISQRNYVNPIEIT